MQTPQTFSLLECMVWRHWGSRLCGLGFGADKSTPPTSIPTKINETVQYSQFYQHKEAEKDPILAKQSLNASLLGHDEKLNQPLYI